MLDKNDIGQIKELLKPLATKEDLKREIGNATDGLAVMINKAFNENEKKMAEGFKMINNKLDKKLEKSEGIKVIKEALAIE